MSSKSDLAIPVAETDHAMGPESARVTLVEYGDYECPDCVEFGADCSAVDRTILGMIWRVVFPAFSAAFCASACECGSAGGGGGGVAGEILGDCIGCFFRISKSYTKWILRTWLCSLV